MRTRWYVARAAFRKRTCAARAWPPYRESGRVPSRIALNRGSALGRVCFVVARTMSVRPMTWSMPDMSMRRLLWSGLVVGSETISNPAKSVRGSDRRSPTPDPATQNRSGFGGLLPHALPAVQPRLREIAHVRIASEPGGIERPASDCDRWLPAQADDVDDDLLVGFLCANPMMKPSGTDTERHVPGSGKFKPVAGRLTSTKATDELTAWVNVCLMTTPSTARIPTGRSKRTAPLAPTTPTRRRRRPRCGRRCRPRR